MDTWVSENNAEMNMEVQVSFSPGFLFAEVYILRTFTLMLQFCCKHGAWE